MTEPTYIQFQWEGTDNPNDPSGVATFTYRDKKVTICMNAFNEAVKLNSMIEKALYQSRIDTLDSAETAITDFLHRKRYDV